MGLFDNMIVNLLGNQVGFGRRVCLKWCLIFLLYSFWNDDTPLFLQLFLWFVGMISDMDVIKIDFYLLNVIFFYI